MNSIQKINNKIILLSPLDWGYGHTTRCVSIIRTLSIRNTVIFAGNKSQIVFILKEFPQIRTEFIDGYNISLSSKRSTYAQITKQSLKISNAIQKEHNWVRKFTDTNHVDLIISDNRYAFRHKSIESIFIGHQLSLDLPHFKKLINKRLISYINRFNTCWIPDDIKLNISGKLSNTDSLEIPFKYIGLLCRFTRQEVDVKYKFLAIISGPTPENTIFLNQIQNIATRLNVKFAIVSPIRFNNDLNLNNIDFLFFW